MKEEPIFSTRAERGERTLEDSLRPLSMSDFIGQSRVKDNLQIYIQAAQRRGDVLDHILLSGPPGLGKTTMSRIVAAEMQRQLHTAQGPGLQKTGDLAGILTSLQEGDVLFIDEVHRLAPALQECLYGAMEDFKIDILIGEGPSARTLTMQLPRFTLVGATTREGSLSKPFRSRFGVVEKFEEYPWEDLVHIVTRSAAILKVGLADDAAEILARRSRGTPRLVNRFLRRVRDIAEVKGDGNVTRPIALEGLDRMGVDEHGLHTIDRKILETLLMQNGKPVGLKTLAIVVSDTEDTIEDVYEPFLIREGYIGKTPQGRVALAKAFDLFGRKPAQPQADMFG